MLSPLSGGDVAGAGDHGGGSSGYGSDRSQHHDLRAALRKIINKEINPFVNNWEEEGQFLAQEVFKTLGQAGSLGVGKTTAQTKIMIIMLYPFKPRSYSILCKED